MANISTPIKIVIAAAAALVVAMLVMYFMSNNTTSSAPLEVDKPLDFTNAETGTPGPVFYIEDSKLDSLLAVLLKEDGQTATSAYTKSYTQSSLREGQLYLRRNMPGTQDPSAVLDRYIGINMCQSDECDTKKTKIDNDEYTMVFSIVLEEFWYDGVLTTRTHKEGVLVTGILSKGKPAPSLTASTIASPSTTVAP